MTRLLATVAAVVAVAASAAPSSQASTAGVCAAPSKWKSVHRTNYVQGCQVCRAFGVRAVRAEYRVRAADAAGVALGFARASMRPAFQQAAFEGCLRGFRLRA